MAKRGRRSQKEWQDIVADYRRSGLSLSEYGRKHGISPSSLWYAIGRHGQQQQSTKSFVEIMPITNPKQEPTVRGCRVELELGSSMVLRIM